MPVKPPEPKHTIEDFGSKLVISIPSLRHWGLAMMLALWLIMWALFVALILGLLIFGENQHDRPPILFLIFWLGIWIAVGVTFIYSFAWQVAGKEVAEVTTDAITISRRVLGLHSSREYTASHVKDLRVTSASMGMRGPLLVWTHTYYYPWRHDMGSLAFDYGARTFRFGGGIDEAEAKQIIAEIQRKFPQYKN